MLSSTGIRIPQQYTQLKNILQYMVCTEEYMYILRIKEYVHTLLAYKRIFS